MVAPNMFAKTSVILMLTIFCDLRAQNVSKIFSATGDISVAVILSDCKTSVEELSYSQRTLVNSALWVTERINFLETTNPLKLGLSVYETCSELDVLKTIFELYENDSTYTIGLVAVPELSEKAKKFSDVLGLRSRRKKRYINYIAKAAVEFLNIMGWKNDITVITSDEQIVEFFYFHSKKRRICIYECYIYEEASSIALNATGEDPLVFFGTASDINQFVANDTHLDKLTSDIVFVPLDGDVPTDLPDGSFLILPPHSPPQAIKANSNIFPTPLIFEIAEPLINYALETNSFVKTNCNDTFYKINCLKNKAVNMMHLFPVISALDVMKSLKIESLEQYFGYNIYEIRNMHSNDSNVVNSNIYLKPFTKVFTYNMFYDNLTLVDESFEIRYPSLPNNTEEDFPGGTCPNELLITRYNRVIDRSKYITFRTEAWIYAFISLSLLGILFCIAILVFLIVAIFQRRVLEGNPMLTLLLLLAVILIFCSVLTFSIENTRRIYKTLCTVKALSVTLSYAAVFSLLLSRSIVLSSAAKEVGFMSHIAGPVQSFLCLFIFGVQAALSLHVLGRCNNVFTHGYDFVYLMSYNTMLLILLICLIPLIYKSQRNYREGKYFAIAIILIALAWCVWLPGFTILCDEWKELMVCLGLVTTGGICLGTIFIPRTYLMTIAAERDKITSALPSLNAAASAVDIYRAHTQPIYDCVNVAAINAATVARAGVTPTAPATTLQQPDLYSCPALPEDIDFDLCCDSPTNTDKVTRF